MNQKPFWPFLPYRPLSKPLTQYRLRRYRGEKVERRRKKEEEVGEKREAKRKSDREKRKRKGEEKGCRGGVLDLSDQQQNATNGRGVQRQREAVHLRTRLLTFITCSFRHRLRIFFFFIFRFSIPKLFHLFSQ